VDLVIVSSRYPSDENIYAHMFVHARVKSFINMGLNVRVYVPAEVVSVYHYEGVEVTLAPSRLIASKLGDNCLVYFHLLNIYPNSKTTGWPIYKAVMEKKLPSVLYIHGSEVQKTTSRSFEQYTSLLSRLKAWYKNNVFIPRMKRFMGYLNQNGGVLTPSTWMLKESEEQLDIKISNYEIIPNGVDCEHFYFSPNFSKRQKMLCIRPLSSKKYAVDKAIELLSLLPREYTLDVYGQGELKSELEELARRLHVDDRVSFIERFVHRKDLPELLEAYGTFLATTRMDAQGVIMCDSVAAGILSITSDNTAIPEFGLNLDNGILIENERISPTDLLEALNNERLFSELVTNARKSMEEISIGNSAEREHQYLLSVFDRKMNAA